MRSSFTAMALASAIVTMTALPALSQTLTNTHSVDDKPVSGPETTTPDVAKMGLMPNPLAMHLNDTSVSGDQYRTDTTHIDDYGRINLGFAMDPKSKDAKPSGNQLPAIQRPGTPAAPAIRTTPKSTTPSVNTAVGPSPQTSRPGSDPTFHKAAPALRKNPVGMAPPVEQEVRR